MVCAIRNDSETEIWTVPVDDAAADAAILTRLKTSAVSELDWTLRGISTSGILKTMSVMSCFPQASFTSRG